MKLVAVSQRVEWLAARQERRDALDQRMAAFLCAAGVLPAPAPNGLITQDPALLERWLHTLDPFGVVLTGGYDLGVHPDRDRTEAALLDFAHARSRPVLGVCRGMQAMGAWAGTGLKPVDGHVRTRHVLTGEVSGAVNSFHAFALNACPKGFKITAHSADGEIEAIRHLTSPWEGWMWHPEREPVFDPRDLQGVRRLFCEDAQ